MGRRDGNKNGRSNGASSQEEKNEKNIDDTLNVKGKDDRLLEENLLENSLLQQIIKAKDELLIAKDKIIKEMEENNLLLKKKYNF